MIKVSENTANVALTANSIKAKTPTIFAAFFPLRFTPKIFADDRLGLVMFKVPNEVLCESESPDLDRLRLVSDLDAQRPLRMKVLFCRAA